MPLGKWLSAYRIDHPVFVVVVGGAEQPGIVVQAFYLGPGHLARRGCQYFVVVIRRWRAGGVIIRICIADEIVAIIIGYGKVFIVADPCGV